MDQQLQAPAHLFDDLEAFDTVDSFVQPLNLVTAFDLANTYTVSLYSVAEWRAVVRVNSHRVVDCRASSRHGFF